MDINNSNQKKWYHNKELTILALILLFPVGLVMLWTGKEFTFDKKAIISSVILLILILAYSASHTSQNITATNHPQVNQVQNIKEVPVKSNVPEDQVVFVKTVLSFIEPYKQASNELKKSTIRTDRKDKLKETLKTGGINNWVGKIKTLGTNSDGDAYIEIKLLEANISLKTWNNALSDIGSNSMIKHGTTLFKTIADLNEGDEVKIKGLFYKDSRDFIKELSLTEDGSMTEPEFLVKFMDIEKIK